MRGTDIPKEEREDFFSAFAKALPVLIEKKKKLLSKGLTAGRITCPWCGAKGACAIAVAGGNNHLRAHCTACNRSMME